MESAQAEDDRMTSVEPPSEGRTTLEAILNPVRGSAGHAQHTSRAWELVAFKMRELQASGMILKIGTPTIS